MPRQRQITEVLNEGQDYDLTFVFDEDTTGETLQVRSRAVEGTGTGQALGSDTGGAASTEIEITVSFSLLSAGNYNIEVWQDFGGSNQKMLYPNEQETAEFKIVDRFSV